jgi:1,4-alpha-glucan branching enzyme
LGLPKPGTWLEILNTDAEVYGGSGVGNFGRIEAHGDGSHGQPHSASISIPPLGAVWFKPAS